MFRNTEVQKSFVFRTDAVSELCMVSGIFRRGSKIYCTYNLRRTDCYYTADKSHVR